MNSSMMPKRGTPKTHGFVDQLQNYIELMRLNKPIGVWLLLWPTLWALWLAGEGRPDGGIFLVFMLGVIVMRSAGCVLNDFADRNIDPYVERTRNRPIASGAVAPAEALTLFVALALIAIGLAAMLNPMAQMLAGGAAALTVLYPFIKRFVSIPQFILGAAFGWAVPMAFAAQTGDASQLGWLVFGIALIWAVIYDTFYAMVDREDDLKIGVKSTAILFGDADLFVIGGLQLLMLVALVFVGDMAELGIWYYGGVAIAAILMGYHQWLARNRHPDACFEAFLHNHYVGMVVFVGIVLNYTFESPIG
jgi:4-hydroxybenzoate polyprenyltransferase